MVKSVISFLFLSQLHSLLFLARRVFYGKIRVNTDLPFDDLNKGAPNLDMSRKIVQELQDVLAIALNRVGVNFPSASLELILQGASNS